MTHQGTKSVKCRRLHFEVRDAVPLTVKLLEFPDHPGIGQGQVQATSMRPVETRSSNLDLYAVKKIRDLRNPPRISHN